MHINWQGWNWFFQSQDKPKRLLIPEQVISIQPTHSKLSYLMLFPTAPSNYVMYNVVYKCLNVLCSTKCVLFNDSVYKTFQKTKKNLVLKIMLYLYLTFKGTNTRWTWEFSKSVKIKGQWKGKLSETIFLVR